MINETKTSAQKAVVALGGKNVGKTGWAIPGWQYQNAWICIHFETLQSKVFILKKWHAFLVSTTHKLAKND